MRTIIICLLIILVFSAYMAFTQDNPKKEVPVATAAATVQPYKNIQPNNEYTIEIIEEEDDE